jgi:hypothetical protein
MGVVAALQFSIAAAQSLLALTVLCWLSLLLVRHERIEAPRFFLVLLVYAALTLVSAAFSIDRRDSSSRRSNWCCSCWCRSSTASVPAPKRAPSSR